MGAPKGNRHLGCHLGVAGGVLIIMFGRLGSRPNNFPENLPIPDAK